MQVLDRLNEVRLAEDEVDISRLVDRDGCQFHGSLLCIATAVGGSATTQRAPSSHSATPLYRAPHAGNLLGGSFAGGCDLTHGIEELALGSGPRGARFALIEPAVVLQLERAVITEEFQRADRAVGARYSFCVFDPAGEGEAVSGGERLHVGERVLRIGLRVVGH